MRTRTLLGLTVASLIPLLGPRPYFVKTAFAAETAILEVTEVISINQVETCRLIADRRCDSFERSVRPSGPTLAFVRHVGFIRRV